MGLIRRNWAGALALVATALLANHLGSDGLVYAGIFGFVGKAVKSLVPSALSFIPGVGPIAGGIAGKLLGGGGGGGEKGGGGILGSGISLEQLLGIGGGILGGISAGKNRGQSNQILLDAIARQQQEAQARLPFRDLVSQNLTQGGGLQQQNPDLSQAFADPSNPFAVGAPAPPVAEQAAAPTIKVGPRPTIDQAALGAARRKLDRGGARKRRAAKADVGIIGAPDRRL